MKRFKKILVIQNDLEGDQGTMDRAFQLARENGAELIIAANFPHHENDEKSEPYVSRKTDEMEQKLEAARQAQVNASMVLFKGILIIEVVRYVLSEGVDLVIMTADGAGGFKELFFGSNSLRMMRKCPCAVWVTKPVKHAPYNGIIAAVDPMTEETNHRELNIKIIELATSLARLENCPLHIAHSWQLEGSDLETSRSEISLEIMEGLIAKNERIHRTMLEKLLKDFDFSGIDHTIHLIQGEAGFAIPKLTQSEEIDCIVMGTVCRTGIIGFLIGNTAETILQQVECSVLSLKPEGFVSPITLD